MFSNAAYCLKKFPMFWGAGGRQSFLPKCLKFLPILKDVKSQNITVYDNFENLVF
jgi:hypothetical protein